jgi:hypothetical protein
VGAEGDCELDSPAPVSWDSHERDLERLFSAVIDDGARIGTLDVCDRRADPDSACLCATSNHDVSDSTRGLSSEVDAALQRREQTRRSRVGRQLTSPVEPSDEMPSVKLREGRADLDSSYSTTSPCRIVFSVITLGSAN